MRKSISALTLALPLALMGCNEKAKTSPAETPAPASAKIVTKAEAAKPEGAVGTSIKSQEAGGEYTIDPAHTQAIFKVGHFGASHQTGLFRSISGSFNLDAEDPSKSTAAIEIDAASIYTGMQKRDDHLKSPDFFDVKQFPNIVFKSTAVEASGPNEYQVSGDLTIHGVTKSVTIPFTHNAALTLPKEMGGAFITGFDGALTIDRHDYGISWGKGALGDEIAISLTLEGMRK